MTQTGSFFRDVFACWKLTILERGLLRVLRYIGTADRKCHHTHSKSHVQSDSRVCVCAPHPPRLAGLFEVVMLEKLAEDLGTFHESFFFFRHVAKMIPQEGRRAVPRP